MSAGAASVAERIRQHLVELRVPRSLEMLDHVQRQLERGEVISTCSNRRAAE